MLAYTNDRHTSKLRKMDDLVLGPQDIHEGISGRSAQWVTRQEAGVHDSTR